MTAVSLSRTLVTTLALTAAGTAYAHTGDHALLGFMSGWSHPWMGLDHLLAMLAVGLWAAQQGGRALWAVPLTFVAAMVVGGALAGFGIVLPFVETGIALSVLVLGLLLVWQQRLPLAAGMGIVGVFALFHGFAHGLEMPLAVSPVLYALGFVLATSLLHGIGVLAGSYSKPALRIAGAATALNGATLLLAS